MDPLKLTPSLPKHLLDIQSLGKEGISFILSLSDAKIPLSSGNACLLFFEDSTRTKLSFELAAKNIGKNTFVPNLAQSSITKGETILDTAKTVASMGFDQIILRCSENGLPEEVASILNDKCSLINAGDGSHQHPSQALTDLYVLNQHCQGNWTEMSIGLVGDIAHSRVANSLLDGLQLMGVGDIRLIAPPCWQHKGQYIGRKIDDLAEGLSGLHAVIALRAQGERMPDMDAGSIQKIQSPFQIQKKHVSLMGKNAIIMHPGPALRDQELADDVLSHPQCKILAQVSAGVLVRQAILSLF